MPNLSQLLGHHSRYRSKFPALTFDHETLCFDDFNQKVSQLGRALLHAGLKKGDRFATVLPNCIEMMAAYWAAAATGLVIVPCSSLLQPAGLMTLLNDAEAKLVIAGIDQLETLEQIKSELIHVTEYGCILTDPSPPPGYMGFTEWVSNTPLTVLPDDISGDDVFNIMYTSGTTGQPKGIVHTHHIRSMYCTIFASAWRMTPESVVLHAGAIVFNGAMLCLMPWMMLGCHYILHRSFNPEKVIDDIEKFQVTHVVMVPAQIIAILNSPAFSPERLDSLQMLHNVGAPLHLHFKKRINQLLPLRYYELYGVTEGFMTILDRTEAVTKEGSVGKPAPFNEVIILDDNGNQSEPGKIGEICGRGPFVMSGYHNNPELTNSTFRNGWLCSGDLGYLDGDGYLFLVDRKKDMIISGGINVYPKDIEEVVVLHPAVNEVAVFGISDDKWGEVPVAAVTLATSVDIDTLKDWINMRVGAKFQRVSRVLCLEEFPRNVAGKILKRELPKLLID